MKKSFLYIFIYIIAIGVNVSCSDSWDERYAEVAFEGASAASLSVSAESLEFTDQASSQQLDISSNCHWTANSSANWLTLSSTLGSRNASLTVTAEANMSTTQDRTANITVSNGFATYTVSVKQLKKQETLDVSPSLLTFTFEGGQQRVTVSANASWSVSSNASWLTVSKDEESSSFTATVQRYVSTQARTATITVRGATLNQTIEVTQNGAQAPTINKLTTKDITKHEATCNMSANSPDLDITEYGICYSSLFETPSLANADVLKQKDGGRKVGYRFQLTGLSSRTTYHVRPYIVTELGTLYGETIQFSTPASAPNENDNGTPND